jgi:very-short-patch-repair endonuclease
VGHRPRAEHLEHLRKTADPASSLEQDWLSFIEAGGYRLPDEAQKPITEVGASPDFYYAEGNVCIYVDGSHHEFADRAVRDEAANARLRDAGYEVIRFGLRNNWEDLVKTHNWVFGEGQA